MARPSKNMVVYLISILYQKPDGSISVDRFAETSKIRATKLYQEKLEGVVGKGTISFDAVYPNGNGLTQVQLICRMLENKGWESRPKQLLEYAEFDVPLPTTQH